MRVADRLPRAEIPARSSQLSLVRPTQEGPNFRMGVGAKAHNPPSQSWEVYRSVLDGRQYHLTDVVPQPVNLPRPHKVSERRLRKERRLIPHL